MSKKSNTSGLKLTLIIILVVAGAISGFMLIKSQMTPKGLKPQDQATIDSLMRNVTAAVEVDSTPMADDSVIYIDSTDLIKDSTITPPITSPTTTQIVAGKWVIVVSSGKDSLASYRELTKLQAQGFRADIIKADVKGQKYFRMCLVGFETEASAKAYLDSLKQANATYKDAWLMKTE